MWNKQTRKTIIISESFISDQSKDASIDTKSKTKEEEKKNNSKVDISDKDTHARSIII